MGKYNRIMVAVDGSEASLHALQESFKLVDNWVTVVSVSPFYEGDLRLLGVPKSSRLIREPCDTALARAQELATAAGAMIQPVCEEGVLHERIVARAEVGSRDLIIMGTKGHGVLDRTIAGSVTRRVIEYSSKDILVVPAEAKVAWDRILLATDGSPNSRAAATRALDLARTYGSELKVLSVINIPESIDGQAEDLAPALYHIHRDNVAEITGQAAGRALKAEGLVGVGRPAQVITQMARELQADLIIMGSHGRTGIKRLLLGSVTEKVIGQAPCPVLVVKGEELG